jgi:hypothetical protein
MIIVFLVATVISAECLAEVAHRAHLGRHTVNSMQRHKPPSTIRILRTAEEMQRALRHMNEAERLKARQADTRSDHYAAVAYAVAANNIATQSVLSSTSRSIGAPHQ